MKPILYTKKREPIFLGEVFYFITVNNTSCYCDTTKDKYKEHTNGYNFKTDLECKEYINNNFK